MSFGFASGGGEYSAGAADKPCRRVMLDGRPEGGETPLPFAGGAGAGVSLSPAAFLLVGNGQIRCIPVQNDLILQIGECLRQFTERKEGEGC